MMMIKAPSSLQRAILRVGVGRTLSSFSFSSSSSFSSSFSNNTNANETNNDKSPHNVTGRHGIYLKEYENSLNDPEGFWKQASKDLDWYKEPTKILTNANANANANKKDLDTDEASSSLSTWFEDGEINMCYNCLDVHVQNGRGDQTALIYDSPLTATKQTFTYNGLLDEVSKFASMLQHKYSVEVGDRIVIYMPMIPHAVIAMLACTRIGAIHSVVFGGFAARELATRIIDCEPKIIISASAGVEPNRIVPYKPLLKEALQIVAATATHNHVEKCIIVDRPNINIVVVDDEDDEEEFVYDDYDEVMNKYTSQDEHSVAVDAIPLPSTHPIWILYTSGTTGIPKGVLRSTGCYATALKWSMDNFYNTSPGEVYWAASDIGWAVGHSYTVYGPLLHGCTTVLYEGKPTYPDPSQYWRIIDEYKVTTMFTAPTAFRAIRQVDPNGTYIKQYDVSSLRTLFLAGERSDPDTIQWCENILNNNVPVIDHWWQTELGWPALGNSIGLGHIPIKYGACAGPVPGYDIRILDHETGMEVPNGTLGDLVIKLPLPPGTLPTLYKNEKRYIEEYLTRYPGYYNTGDVATKDEKTGLYVSVMGRNDDIINTAGHRLSTGAIEEVLMLHPRTAEVAVIGVNDELKGEVPMGFVVLTTTTTTTTTTSDNDNDNDNDNVNDNHDSEQIIRQQLIDLVRDKIGPFASFKKVALVKALPKTRSGKILRGTMRKIANNEEYVITPTIDDPTIFDKFLESQIKQLVAEK